MRPVPPLWVWPLGTGLAAGVALLMLLWVNHATRPAIEPSGRAAAYARQVLDLPRVPGNIRVLGMGSSLLVAATPPPAYQTASHLRWNRLSNPGLGMDFLGPSLPEVEQHPPDILVIEKNLLLVDPQHQMMGRLRSNVALGLKKIAAIAIPSLIQSEPMLEVLQRQDEKIFCEQLPKQNNAIDFKNYIHFLNIIYNSLQVDPTLSSALQRLSKRGVSIVILDIQRSIPVERQTAAAKQAWFAQLRQLLPPGARLTYLTSPSYDSGTLYCDGSHLSPAGSRRFMAWWTPELLQLQKAMH
ncbi:hypothetical protein ACL9RI_14870 [Janthinobacterium sp. Mn2066]|uniref:hypothetical protein n=1 Tax=Janthinobacterium sp. Mn2066 TaxID=3395264 RepID=UPI003BCF7C6C